MALVTENRIRITITEPVFSYYVSPNGNDSNSGAKDKPFKTINKAVATAQPGESVYVANGTYSESIKFPRSGTVDKHIKLVGQSEKGVVLDGKLTKGFAVDMAAVKFIDVSRFTAHSYFSGYHPQESTIRLGADCTVTDVSSVRNVGGGVGIPSGSHRVKLIRVKANDNGLDGFQGARFDDGYFEDTENHRNNQGHLLNADRAKANPSSYRQRSDGRWCKNTGHEVNKFARTRNRTMVRHKASGNNGLDLWDDIDNINTTLTDCDVDFYAFEISPGPLTVNGGSGHIGIWESSRYSLDEGKTWLTNRWKVKGHLFNKLAKEINKDGFAMELRQMRQNRSYVEHRTNKKVLIEFGPGDITDCTIIGGPIHTDGDQFAIKTPTEMGMVMDRNTYSPDCRDICVFWGSYAKGRWNLAACQKNGIEKNGKVVKLPI